MRLRSNHVLEPVSEWQPPRRRRGTRGASAQPETEVAIQSVTEPTNATPAQPARKGRTAKKGRKKTNPAISVVEEAAVSSLSPAPSPLITPSLLRSPPIEAPTIEPSVGPSAELNNQSRLAHPPQCRKRRAFAYGSASEILAAALKEPTHRAPAEPKPRNRLFRYNYPPLPRAQAQALGQVPWSLDTPNHPGLYLSTGVIGLPGGLVLFPNNSEDSDAYFTPKIELTLPEDGSRKRDRHAEHETPMKRYKSAQPATPLGSFIRPRGSSRTTYADRTRRRQAESGGRIHRTMLRLPELLAQQNADAKSAPASEDSRTNDQTTASGQVPPSRRSSLPSSLPEPTNSPGWGRWIFDGVSRRWTGLLGRTSSPQAADVSHVTERQQQEVVAEAEVERRLESENEHFVTAPSSTIHQSSAVLRSGDSPTPATHVTATSSKKSTRLATPKSTRTVRKNYDLFSRGYDAAQRARWMSNAVPSSADDRDPSRSPLQESGAPSSTKRKRQSPDVIPNPPGCSYGINDDYFIYDDEDWADQERDNPDATPTKRITEKSPEEQDRVSKRVRVERPANFNHEGHFETPGWSSNSESASSTRTTPLSPNPTGAPVGQTTVENVENVEPARKATHHGAASKNSLTGLKDRQLLKKARDQAEQYKPKTPSRLRSAHRFSSSSNHGGSSFQQELMYNSEDAIRRRRMRETSLAKACPTGDLREIIWPEFDRWVERLSCFINEDVVEWVNSNPHRQDRQHLENQQHRFNLRYQEELDKKRADPDYVPQMWFYPK